MRVGLVSGFLTCTLFGSIVGCSDEEQPRVERVKQPTAADQFYSMQYGFRQLQIGMSQDQVQSILGAPDSVSVDYGHARWLYYPSLGGATVSFDTTGRVNGWHELDWETMRRRIEAQNFANRQRAAEALLWYEILRN